METEKEKSRELKCSIRANRLIRGSLWETLSLETHDTGCLRTSNESHRKRNRSGNAIDSWGAFSTINSR